VVAALRAHYFALRRSLGRLRGARQGGAGYGATPPSRPPLHPPRSTPIRKVFNFLSVARATRLLLRELPSLATLAQAIPLRAALMPEDAFALNVGQFQLDTPNIIVSFWIAFTLFSVALNILTSPQLTCNDTNFRSAMTRQEIYESKNIFTIRSWSWGRLPYTRQSEAKAMAGVE